MKVVQYALPTLFAASLLVLVGCANEHRADLPSNAVTAASGNDRLTYTAPSDGTIWVYDVANDKIIYSGPVMKNDGVVVDPEANAVSISGKVVSEKTLAMGAMNRILFQSSDNTPTGTGTHSAW